MAEIPTIAEAAALIAARKLSPVELTRACLARIERLNGTLHAFIKLTPERALAEARPPRRRSPPGPRGPLHGIPIGAQGHLRDRRGGDDGHSKVHAGPRAARPTRSPSTKLRAPARP